MPNDQAAEVSSYIEQAAAERRPLLDAIRTACGEELAGFTESFEHRMPCYSRDGQIEFAFASQKQYLSLYVKHDVVAEHTERLAGLDHGKGCIRIRKPEQADLELIRSLLRATADSSRPVS